MTNEQKKKAMELLIENETKLIKTTISTIGASTYGDLNLSDLKADLLVLMDNIDELEKLKSEYESDFPIQEFTYDDIPF